MNVVILVISEWWLVEQVYSRQWDSSDKAGQISSLEGKISCWEKQLRLTLPSPLLWPFLQAAKTFLSLFSIA